jgi:hypothetical protein
VFGDTVFHAAETLPAELSDEAFWKMVRMSEPDGAFSSKTLIHELGYQYVILAHSEHAGSSPALLQSRTSPTPWQWPAVLHRDIRRQNMGAC